MNSRAGWHEFLQSRRSVRRFLPRPVDDAAVRRILETATCAPSAHGSQPWRFAVLPQGDRRFRLAEALEREFRADLLRDGVGEAEISKRVRTSNARLLAAPVLILLCADSALVDHYADEKRRRASHLMLVQSVAAAGIQLLLAAHAEGLGGVWICSPLFAPKAVRAALELPPSWEPQAMYYLGHFEHLPSQKARRPLEDMVSWL